jgi:hypothetical protein
MKTIIRDYALRLKEDCEDYRSLVPKWLRAMLHGFGRHLYHWTYGLSPAKVEAIMNGEADVAPEMFIFANRCRKHYSGTMHPDGSQSWKINFEENAFLSILAFYGLKGNWRRMLEINGVWLDTLDEFEDSNDTAERYELPKGTRFYYLEPADHEN